MGLLAELVVRTYHESQGRPIYFVRQVVAYQERTANVRHLGIRK